MSPERAAYDSLGRKAQAVGGRELKFVPEILIAHAKKMRRDAACGARKQMPTAPKIDGAGKPDMGGLIPQTSVHQWNTFGR